MKESGARMIKHINKFITLMLIMVIAGIYNVFFTSTAHAEINQSLKLDNTFYFIGYPDVTTTTPGARKELARYDPDTGKTEVILDMTSMGEDTQVWLGTNNKVFIKSKRQLWIYDMNTKDLQTRDLSFFNDLYDVNYNDYTFGSDNKMYFQWSKLRERTRIGQYDPETNSVKQLSIDTGYSYYGFKAGYKNDVYFFESSSGGGKNTFWKLNLSDGSTSRVDSYVNKYGMDTSGGIYIDYAGDDDFYVRGYPTLVTERGLGATYVYDSPEPYNIYYTTNNGLFKYIIDPTTWTASKTSIPQGTAISQAVNDVFNYSGIWYKRLQNPDTGLYNTLRMTDPKTGNISDVTLPQYKLIFAESYYIHYGKQVGKPGMEIVSPTPNQTLGGVNSPFIPSVKVRDSDGDKLTVSYYVDSESQPRDTRVITNTATIQLVSFNGLNIWDLSEGAHRLKFTVTDGKDSVEDSVQFVVDKSPPQINSYSITSSDSSIQVSGAATDNGSGLDAAPYRITVGNDVTSWTGSTTYTKNFLTPNTAYYTKFEAKDRLGQIAFRESQIYTKAQIPALTLNKVLDTSIAFAINDSNPSYTKYQLMAQGKYVGQSGQLTNSPEWITATGKAVQVTGLMPNASYAFQVKALNAVGEETQWSSPINVITVPGVPSNIASNPSQRSIVVSWAAEPGITGYEVEADGAVVENGTQNSYEHRGLVPSSNHTYRIRAKNAGGTGNWSAPVMVSTLPDPPPSPGNLSTIPTQTEISVTWDIAARATEYELEVDGATVMVGNNTSYVHRGLQPLTDHTYRIRAKNNGGVSQWSNPVVQKTLPYPPKTPEHFVGQPLIHDVSLSWDDTEGADAYEVEADGFIIDNGSETKFVHDGLDPLTGHTYRVRARNAGGKSPWSQPLNITTHPEKPITPGNVMATSDETAITVMWYLVPHAESYDVEIDGKSIMNVAGNQLVDPGLTPDSKHTYRVRAKNISGVSEWTSPITMATLPTGSALSLTNMVAVVTNRFITISWDTVAPDAQYEIEVDGQLEDNGKNTIYNHTGLQANEFHTYKIRLKNEKSAGEWVAILSLSTLPDPPDAPSEIEAFATNSTIELRWQKVEGSDGYDIEVDGKTIDVGLNTNYLHTQLAPGTMHTYRVRAKNVTGITAWSAALSKSTTSPTYTVEGKIDQQFDLTLLASNVQDFSESDFVVTYNPQEIEVVDLYNFTPFLDTNPSGNIAGSNLEVIYSPGNIRFKVKQNIVPGTSWSGEVTTLVFKFKIDGKSSLDVVVD